MAAYRLKRVDHWLLVIVLLGSPLPGASQNPGEHSHRPHHIDARTESAIQRGLEYLARTQSQQGAWNSAGGYGSYPVAMTALASVSLLMSGSTTTEGPYAEQLNKATTYILSQAQPNGLIASPMEEARSMYAHGFSLLYLGQLHGMEESSARQQQIAEVLRKGIELTSRSQSTDGGWLYTPTDAGDEGSVTVTQVQGMRSAKTAGIAVSKKVIDQAMAYLDMSMRPDGGIAYRARDMAGSRPPITAAALVCWFNAGQFDHPNVPRAMKYCARNIGIGDHASGVAGHFYYAHLYYAQAMYLAGDETWNAYFPRMRDYLLKAQNPDGSWEGDSVGKVYGTALALTILQLPYNTLPIMQR
ncbi:MAG: hypothetical protein HJJLKODD_01040 [Phycisphaerae bacterium]|nr:hypothetical protein [Phycisphaerae bacterium]